jgi:hypothetical protein
VFENNIYYGGSIILGIKIDKSKIRLKRLKMKSSTNPTLLNDWPIRSCLKAMRRRSKTFWSSTWERTRKERSIQ